MNYNKHLNLEGKHAFLGASNYAWLNDDDDKLRKRWNSQRARYLGTELHEVASKLIKLGIKLPSSRKTLNMFVNDAIGYRMKSELVLYYSDNCFGTADALVYVERTKKLRIHDLKTGITPASMKQLYIYTALFCLEYAKDPYKVDTELRIYQSDDVVIENPEPTDILQIMKKIQHNDEVVDELRAKEESIW